MGVEVRRKGVTDEVRVVAVEEARPAAHHSTCPN